MNNKVVLYVLYAIVIAALAYLVYVTDGFGIWKNSGALNKDKYQAVFLTNGQVYFGKVTSMNSKSTTLEDIYYLQVEQVQPKPEEDPEQKLTLIKLGNELHGPEDQMVINAKQIVFWENLNDEGKVVQAIKQYQTQGPTQETTGSTEVEATQ